VGRVIGTATSAADAIDLFDRQSRSLAAIVLACVAGFFLWPRPLFFGALVFGTAVQAGAAGGVLRTLADQTPGDGAMPQPCLPSIGRGTGARG